MLKRISKIVALLGAGFLFLLLLVSLFTQTPSFRNWLREFLLSEVSANLNGTLILGQINGNIISGFTIDSVRIETGGEVVISAGRIGADYQLLPLLRREFRLKRLIIEQPMIRIVRPRSGGWNIARLFRSSGDSSQSVFDWHLFLADVQLKNATVSLVDSATLADTTHHRLDDSFVEYHDFILRDLNLQLDALVAPDHFAATIRHASFYSEQPAIELIHARGNFFADSLGAKVSNLVLQTGKSYLELGAAMKGLNIFRGIDLPEMQHDSAQLTLRSSNLDLQELKSFLPWIEFLDGSLSLDLDAAGEFGDLTVRRLNFKTYHTTMNLSGNVRSLHDPENLLLDVQMGESSIEPADALRLMPRFPLPSFGDVGRTTMIATFKGRPNNFLALATVRSQAGELTLDGTMNLTTPRPTYNVAFTTRNFSLARWFNTPEISSSINSSGRVEGSGLSINDLASSLTAELDSSHFRNIALSPSSLTVKAEAKRMSVEGNLHAEGMSIALSGNANFTNESRPSYDTRFSFTHVDLARLLDDPKYQSNLTLEGTANASGTSIDDISGQVELRLLTSTFGIHELGPEEINFSLMQDNPEKKHLALTSSIANIDLNGKFDLDVATASLSRHAGNLIEVIQRHAAPPDTLIAILPRKRTQFRPHTLRERQMDFDYALTVNNLQPIANLLEASSFDGRGSLRGRIHGNDEHLSLTARGMIEEMYIGTQGEGVLLYNTSLDLTLDSLTLRRPLEQLSATIQLSIGSGLVNDRHIDSVGLDLVYNKMNGSLSLSGVIDSTYSIVLSGVTSVQPNTYVFDVEALLVASGEYRWQNSQDVQLRLNYEGIRVMRAVMERGTEEFALSGILRHTGEFDVNAALRNFDLQGISAIRGGRRRGIAGDGFRGFGSADLHLSGALSDPLITFSALVESTSFRSTKIGTVRGAFSYASRNAVIDVRVTESASDTTPTLTIMGTLPVDLAFTGVDQRFPDEPQNIHVRSEQLNVSALDPLIRELDELVGTLSCDVRIEGTPAHPEYTGNITLTDVQSLFVPNNISYIINGNITPRGEKLLLNNVIVRNLPGEQPNGEGRFTGSITIRDYRVNDFDLTMVGQLLVMSNATRKIVPMMYGPLFAQADESGINLRGTLEQPYLSGKVYILDQNLTFPPTSVQEKNGGTARLHYVLVDDTTKHEAREDRRNRRFFSITSANADAVQPVETAEPSLLDRLRYNLVIETKGTTAIRMIFTPATNEELYAELEGRLTAVNERGTPSIYGDIEIAGQSYYTFFKKFAATGKLRFFGPWDNPELDINATYQGIRVVDTLQQPVRVELDITGTRYEPKLDMAIKIQNERGGTWEERTGDVQSDVISFILTNKFRDDLTSRERAGIQTSFVSTTGGSVVSGFTSNLLSGLFDDFVKKEFPFIRSVEVSYGGGNIQESADVRLSGEAFKGYFRFGGKILNNVGNANVSYLLNLGDVFSAPSIRNLFIQLERRVETDIDERDKETREARLYYRFSF